MKKINILAFLFCCLSANIQAQITYTSASFPQAGDILKVATTFDSLITVTPASATATNWNFSGLVASAHRSDTILAASAGASFSNFPNADILSNLVGNFGTAYTDVTTTTMTDIGGGIEFGNVSIIAPFSDPFVRRTAPLTYGNSNNDNFELAYSEHIDSIPFLRALIDSLSGGFPVSPDSIRFRFDGSITQNVDAFGTCQLPDSTYNVIRQKNTIYTDLRIDVYVDIPLFGGWQDVTNLFTSAIPGGFSPNDTTVFYDYLAEGYKEPIVRQTMNNDETQVVRTEYRSEQPLLSVPKIERFSQNQWKVYPNPAHNVLTVALENIEQQANYSLELVDMLGRTQYRQQTILGNQQQINTSQLAQGQYFIVLRKDNQSVATQAVQITH